MDTVLAAVDVGDGVPRGASVRVGVGVLAALGVRDGGGARARQKGVITLTVPKMVKDGDVTPEMMAPLRPKVEMPAAAPMASHVMAPIPTRPDTPKVSCR